MSELIERLRERAKQLRRDANVDGPFPPKQSVLYEEAADEIERLEGELQAYRIKPEPVQLAADGRCACTCGTKCPLGKTGMSHRCTKDELEAHGIPTIPPEPKVIWVNEYEGGHLTAYASEGKAREPRGGDHIVERRAVKYVESEE
jgi:hypothetical protein